MKSPQLQPNELDLKIVSKVLAKLPMKEINPSRRFKLSDMIDVVGGGSK